MCYLQVGAGPLQVLDLVLDLHQPLAFLVKLLQLLLLLTKLLLIQLLPETHTKYFRFTNRITRCVIHMLKSTHLNIDTGTFIHLLWLVSYLALSVRVRSLGLLQEPAAAPLVLLGCWWRPSSSLAVAASVSSL